MTNVPSLGTNDHIRLTLQEQIAYEDLKKLGGTNAKLNPASKSNFVHDSTINPHPRFAGLVKSIREHRGEKVDIRVPIFKDERTNVT